ncbi:MAG: hypothetical protein J3Q66DRAFT_322666 [Benniella sp.]|nr:MAG: hypothetical protein J3Q66DRAFT_322666 [Benniella sp.]
MSPLAVQPNATSDTTIAATEQVEEEEDFFTPLISPAMTPSHPYANLTHALSTANEIFSPLTSPALQPHRTPIDFLSLSGQAFTPLPSQFHQAQAQQQHLQHQLSQLQSQPQPELTTQNQAHQHQLQLHQQHQLQQQLQQQIQASQASSSSQQRIDPRSPCISAQRPVAKRRPTAERVNGLNVTTPRSAGPVRSGLTKSSSPMSPSSLRKQQAGRGRSSSITPSSPLAMHFPTGRPTPSPLLISTTQPPLSQASQASPSPRLVTNMHQLSMIPPSPMGIINMSNGPSSPALFSLPASSMMPPPSSPMILPSATQIIGTPRQRSLAQPQQPIQIQSQYQLSIHQPISIGQSSPALLPIAEHGMPVGNMYTPVSAPPSDRSDSSIASRTASSASSTPKSALAPVTPASLMNLGSGSGTESTPNSSPKFGVHAKGKSSAAQGVNGTDGGASTIAQAVAASPLVSATSITPIPKRGVKRQANGDIAPTSGTIAPSTPRQMAITPGTPSMVMPPPPSGFALISPALKPTLMSQHRTSQPLLVSPRLQPHVSPSLKPWLPGVSTSEVMARLASKSNYQNILDGDHTALGLSYNTDLHSGIEQRRTSHKAAEQKRRDSLKNCFEDLRHMIPNIQEKSPSKVFLLKKSFDYICNLKSEVAKRDLEMARLRVQHEFMKNAMQVWLTALPEDNPIKQELMAMSQGSADDGEGHSSNTGIGNPLMEKWMMSEEDIRKATAKEEDLAARAAEMAEISAAAVEAAKTQPGGQNKGGRETQADNDDSDEDIPITPKSKKAATKPAVLSAKAANGVKKPVKGGAPANANATSSDVTEQHQQPSSTDISKEVSNKSGAKSSDEDEDNDDDDEDQEMADITAIQA